jgi:hypothetical protein
VQALSASTTNADAIYYSDVATNSIVRTTLAGTDPQVVPVGGGLSMVRLSAFTVDRPTGDLYFTLLEDGLGPTAPTFGLYRTDANGNGRALLYEPPLGEGNDVPQTPISLAINPARDKMYLGAEESFHVFRANLDGSGMEQAVANIGNDLYVIDIAFDPSTHDLYWSQEYGDSGVEGIMTQAHGTSSGFTALTTSGAAGVALDVAAGHIYYADGWNSIHRVNLDGTNDIELIAGLSRPFKMQLDAARGHIYWLETYDVANTVRRANLDGTGVVDIVTGLQATDFYLDVAPVPEPSSWAIVACAAVSALVLFRRRARRCGR